MPLTGDLEADVKWASTPPSLSGPLLPSAPHTPPSALPRAMGPPTGIFPTKESLKERYLTFLAQQLSPPPNSPPWWNRGLQGAATAAPILGGARLPIRLGLQAISGGAPPLLEGKGPRESAKGAALGPLLSLPFEAGAKGYQMARNKPVLAKAEAKNVAAKQAAEAASREAKVAGITEEGAKADVTAARAKYKAEKELSAAALKKAQETHAEQQAIQTMDRLRVKVPAWKNLAPGTKGLEEAIGFPGLKAASLRFDAALQEVVKKGENVSVMIAREDAEILGVSIQGLAPTPTSAALPAGQIETVAVNAAELAKKGTGWWTRDAPLYRRIFNALDAAKVGNPAARTEYRHAVAAYEFMAETKALEGGVFHPDSVAEGVIAAGKFREKPFEKLRSRGLEDSPFLDVARTPPGPTSPYPTYLHEAETQAAQAADAARRQQSIALELEGKVLPQGTRPSWGSYEPLPGYKAFSMQSPWTRRILGTGAGAGVMHLMGGPRPEGALLGLLAEELMLPYRLATGVPGAPGPTAPWLQTLPAVGGVATREGVEQRLGRRP